MYFNIVFKVREAMKNFIFKVRDMATTTSRHCAVCCQQCDKLALLVEHVKQKHANILFDEKIKQYFMQEAWYNYVGGDNQLSFDDYVPEQYVPELMRTFGKKTKEAALFLAKDTGPDNAAAWQEAYQPATYLEALTRALGADDKNEDQALVNKLKEQQAEARSKRKREWCEQLFCEEKNIIKFRRLSRHARMPSYGSLHAAGMDLYAPKDVIIPAQESVIVFTDLAVKFPPQTYGRIADRSSLAKKHALRVGGGVIDPDYRGNVGVLLFNHGKEDYQVQQDDRIAQLICEKFTSPFICYEPDHDDDDDEDAGQRGSGAFGSTGR